MIPKAIPFFKEFLCSPAKAMILFIFLNMAIAPF
jgi:hypothetical protein